VVSWSATDGEVIDGAPAARRRLLDRGLVSLQPRSLEVLARYRRALEQKRQLLYRGQGVLRPWNELLATTAAEIRRLRAAYVELLGAALAELLAESRLDLPPVAVEYRPSPDSERGDAGEILAALEALERQERQRRSPLAGPHREDLVIGWAGHEARRVASGGERKLLGTVLAAARGRVLAAAGRQPTYLLDDLDAELDRGRLEAVWSLFQGAGQVLVSSNRPELWAHLETHSRWRLERGRVSPASEPGRATENLN
jgi:DNA replication and repair protein RecF